MKDWTGTGTSTFKTIGASNHTEKSGKSMTTTPLSLKLPSYYVISLSSHLSSGNVPVEKVIFPRCSRTEGIW